MYILAASLQTANAVYILHYIHCTVIHSIIYMQYALYRMHIIYIIVLHNIENIKSCLKARGVSVLSTVMYFNSREVKVLTI